MASAKDYESEILDFWKKKRIYEKAKKKNSGKKKFYMMDGPPYATGHIHMGTALNKILKDIALRSQRMQGLDVFDRPGYDTHGVPIEFQIEKEIGSRSKKDIEKYGVKKFVAKCKEFATKFIDVMSLEFKNLGVWMDFGNPYLTLSDEYIETIWDTFKIAEKKNLLYLGKYPVHVCPRCETAVAYNEIEYTKKEDTSVFVKFPLKNKKNTYLIIWTTTAWTLPGNAGVMVNPGVSYQEIELSNGERWIIAKELVPKLMPGLELSYTSKAEYKGNEMEGWQYENPLAKNLNLKLKNAYRVILSSRYVNLEEGTGLVHCAPGHGKEDYEVGKEYGLDMPSPVDINGILTDEAGKYKGKKAMDVDNEIINDLEKEGFLVRKIRHPHDYPLCWRCKTPLLLISQPQWFLRISGIHAKLLKENEKTNWVPSWMKLRMKSWLEGLSDWPVSRKRYWGTPLPIWLCDKCNKKIVAGSINELKKLSKRSKIDLHKPGIDKIEIPCSCGSRMKRVPEVFDVWFDSGVSSWAALSYLKDPKNFKKFWPADLNLEGKDQVRGWWNSQLFLSEIKFDRKPFENILVHGMVLDLGKKKMSKSLGNIITPKEIVEKYGRDYLRYYFAKTSKGEDFAFDEKEFLEVGKLFRILDNINNFVNQLKRKKSALKTEDKWIISRFNSLAQNMVEKYNSYRFHEALYMFERFLIFDLSRTYIQIVRERGDETFDTLNKIRTGLLKLLAPACPFTTEKIWQELKEKKAVKEESIHLSSLPKYEKSHISKKLEADFDSVLEITEKGLAERAKAGIGIRWPLAKATIFHEKNLKAFESVIKNQLNLKKVEFKKGKINVRLDTGMNPELEAEGYAREICRRVQAARKKAALKKEQKIFLLLQVDSEMQKLLGKQIEFIKKRTNSSGFMLESLEKKAAKFDCTSDETLKGRKIRINFSIDKKGKK